MSSVSNELEYNYILFYNELKNMFKSEDKILQMASIGSKGEKSSNENVENIVDESILEAKRNRLKGLRSKTK